MRQPYRLEAIALHQVGVFEDMRLEFPEIESPERDTTKAELHVFTGPNGCGKSTLLYALAEIFDQLGGNGRIRRRFRGSDSGVNFQFAGKAGYYGILSDAPSTIPDLNVFGPYQPMHHDFIQDYFFGYGQNGWNEKLNKYKQSTPQFQPQNIHSQERYAFAAFAYSGQRSLQDIQLNAIQQIKNSPFEAALSFDGSARPQILLQWIANNRTQSALAKADGDTKAAATYDLALSRITTLIRDVCELDLEFRLARSPLAVTIQLNGDTIHFDGLPDGLKSIISWVADLSLRLEAIPWEVEQDVFAQPILLFLDEVDIHLHPKWQRRILPAIQKLLPNAQIFVSTHSPFVVGSVEDAWIYRLPEAGESNNGVVQAIPSGAGKSYRLILEEVFGVEGEFDVETEAMFEAFYALRDQFLETPGPTEALLEAARNIADRGEEAAQIIGRELRQVSRMSGVEVSLA